MPPLPIPMDTGVGSTSLAIPPVPALAGLSLYAQALLLPTQRLTNATGDVIRR